MFETNIYLFIFHLTPIFEITSHLQLYIILIYIFFYLYAKIYLKASIQGHIGNMVRNDFDHQENDQDLFFIKRNFFGLLINKLSLFKNKVKYFFPNISLAPYDRCKKLIKKRVVYELDHFRVNTKFNLTLEGPRRHFDVYLNFLIFLLDNFFHFYFHRTYHKIKNVI